MFRVHINLDLKHETRELLFCCFNQTRISLTWHWCWRQSVKPSSMINTKVTQCRTKNTGDSSPFRNRSMSNSYDAPWTNSSSPRNCSAKSSPTALSSSGVIRSFNNTDHLNGVTAPDWYNEFHLSPDGKRLWIIYRSQSGQVIGAHLIFSSRSTSSNDPFGSRISQSILFMNVQDRCIAQTGDFINFTRPVFQPLSPRQSPSNNSQRQSAYGKYLPKIFVTRSI